MVPTLTRKRSKKEDFDKFTIHRKRVEKLLKETEVLIADEVHHLTSASWVSIFERSKAAYRLGLTATPCFDGPGIALEAWTGPIVAEINAGELIERGVLVRPDIWFVRPGCERVEKHLSYPAVYSQGIVHNKRRNELIVHVARIFQAERKPAITLVRRINHGKLLTTQMEARGMRVAFLEGAVPHEKRVRLLEGLWDGSMDHIVAQSTLLGEGVDMPHLRAIINACGTKAGGSPDSDNPGEVGRGTIQFLGRGLRRAPGKTSFEFVDLADNHHKFLKGAAQERVKALESEGYAPFIRYWSDRPSQVVA
jgi:superfamily II DNA or RNA helicase